MPAIPYERIGQYLKEAMIVLKKNGGELKSREVFEQVGKRIDFNDHELEQYEKSGYVRWRSVLHFYSIDAVKAGWIRKQKGYWYLTPEGEAAINLSNMDLIEKARDEYKKWKVTQPEESEEPCDVEESGGGYSVALEQAESEATAGIEEYVRNLNAYEFQDLVAALLHAMGFYTPFIAPKGKDGGVDITAFKDPLGAEAPRIKVQVKHHQANKCGPQIVRELLGLLRKDGEVGIIVSTAGFTADAIVEIQKSPLHIQAIDLKDFIELWQEYYNKMEEEDKKLLPLKWIAFVDEK
ncbi:MAG: Mrr restriction system protein [Candidatus Peribacteraceae bacterium]|nr:Mrr restriction system protein [Candidatus Peribacteraceae bacterium]